MKQPLDFKKKIQKEFPEFEAEVAGLSVEAINQRLAQLAKDGEAVREAREADEGLQSLREQVKEAAAPYREGLSALSLKTRFLVSLVKDKGGE